jgi:D-lactate dehydrogenase (cytochrome)
VFSDLNERAGNFHLFVLFDAANKAELDKAHALNDRLVKRAISMEGTCSGEHGVGIGKMVRFPLGECNAMRLTFSRNTCRWN